LTHGAHTAGNTLVERIKPAAKRTNRSGVSWLGGFGRCSSGNESTILVKNNGRCWHQLLHAIDNVVDGVGIDLVACASTIWSRQGAEPLFQIILTGKLELTATRIINGLPWARIVRLRADRWETAEMPGCT
jgi:phosphoribosylformylglycinamidine cyclo-ligase